MNNRKFRVLSWIIIVTIIITVLAQGYWNWRNYEENRRFLISEIQMALDNTVEQYYAQLAKVHFVQMGKGLLLDQQIDPIIREKDHKDSSIRKIYKSHSSNKEIHKIMLNVDSLVTRPETNMVIVSQLDDIDTLAGTEKRFIKLASKLAMSLASDSLDRSSLDSLMALELNRKGIDEQFEIVSDRPIDLAFNDVVIRANSTYLTSSTELYLITRPALGQILKKSILGVIISLLTALVIVFVLLYLYRFIQDQKSLDLMKNDLISNITHEFKTPIATVSTALEAIEKFNTEKDLAKTAKYLKLSNEQLAKLNGMVEKLLDTATLEEGELILNKENTNLNVLVQEVIHKYENTQDKTISLESNDEIWHEVDTFHFEHLISNLIDNALKYGGDQIKVILFQQECQVNLSVTDNGKGIDRKEQARIFDKFYRIHSGNVHDVKGYGIGLYYARTIVEKHDGQLDLITKHGNTNFKITLPA